MDLKHRFLFLLIWGTIFVCLSSGAKLPSTKQKSKNSRKKLGHMASALLSLKPADRVKFRKLCLDKKKMCKPDILIGKNATLHWKRDNVEDIVKLRFWNIYQCTFKKSPKSCPVDGGWAVWSRWNRCSNNCGPGKRSRNRSCADPSPQNGGLFCHGRSFEKKRCIGNCRLNKGKERYVVLRAWRVLQKMHKRHPWLEESCVDNGCTYATVRAAVGKKYLDEYWSALICYKYKRACAVDGKWSKWSAWSGCTTKCGPGLRQRTRSCDEPKPTNGGAYCTGRSFQETDCVGDDCPKEGILVSKLSDWSAFSECSISCGSYGLRVSKRECYGGGICTVNGKPVQELLHFKPCYGGLCPVKGRWGQWSAWTACSAKCGTGRKGRLRICNATVIDELSSEWCVGDEVKMKKCKLPCTDTGGKVSDDEESIFRILGKEKKPRVKRDDDGDGDEDNNKEKENDGGGDGENKNEDYFLNEGKEKEKVNALADEEENPPDKTTTTLNTKSTIKEVPTTKESPVIKNISKSADILAKGSSKYKPLPSKEPHTAWSEWTKCSASCDGGTRTRTRSCLKRKFPCKGEIRDFQFCNTMACPVEGDWSEWLGWNPCSVTCGTGHRTRYRKCDSPLPLLGGTCVGDDHQRKKCTMPECSKDISSTWTKWSKWTECSKTCGPSKKSRSRKCSTNSGEKSHVCVEASTQTVPCHPRPCPVKGQWAAWSSWAKCSRKCDIGVRIRDRTCTDPAPVGTGKRCIGLGADLSHCFRRPCGDPGELALVFKGEGFLQYPPNDIVSHVLYSFIRFNPSSGEGVLLHGHSANCTSDKCADSFELSLKDGVLCLKVDMVGQKMKLLSKEKLKTGVWHNVLISLIGKRGMMEVDDREQISAKFNVDLEMIDYDLPLTLGGVAPDSQSKTQGFEGKIADLRVNYKKFSLSRDRHWHGYGNPDKKANVKKTKADVEAVYPSFNGSSYLPLSSAPNGTHFQLSLVMKPVNLTGLIAFVPGMVSGSYASVMIRKGKLELCINLKVDRTCRKSGIELKVNSWYFVDINIAGNTAKFHINGNEANQLTVQGQPFTIRGKVYIGGGSNTDWTVFTAAGKVNSGFVGIIEQIILNGRVYSMKRRLLRGRYGHFNGVGASVAVHYNELFENEETVIDLRCDYTEMVLKAKKNEHVHVEWLRGNQKLVLNDHMTLLEEPGFGNVSVLRLRPSHTDANTGIYACLVTFRNTATILRSFGVTYHPYEMVMSFSAELPQISVIVVSVLLAVLALVLFMLQRLGYMRQITRKFNFYGKLAERANKRKKSDAKYERLDGPKAEEEETLDQKAKSSKTSVKSRSKQSVTGSVPGSKKSVKINLTGPSSDSLGASKESLMSKGSKKSIKGDSRSSIKQMSSHRSLASVHQRSGASLSSRSRASVESTVKKEDEISELCDPVLGSASSVASKLREEAEREFSEHLLKSQTNSVVSLKDSVATIGSMTQKGSTISVPSVASVASKKTSGDLSVEKHSSHSVRSTPSKAKES